MGRAGRGGSWGGTGRSDGTGWSGGWDAEGMERGRARRRGQGDATERRSSDGAAERRNCQRTDLPVGFHDTCPRQRQEQQRHHEGEHGGRPGRRSCGNRAGCSRTRELRARAQLSLSILSANTAPRARWWGRGPQSSPGGCVARGDARAPSSRREARELSPVRRAHRVVSRSRTLSKSSRWAEPPAGGVRGELVGVIEAEPSLAARWPRPRAGPVGARKEAARRGWTANSPRRK